MPARWRPRCAKPRKRSACPRPASFHVYPLVARIDHEHPLRPNADEVAEAFEVPLEFLLDPGSARDVAMEWRGRTRLLVEFQWREHRIWGATAAMLVNLRERLQAAAAG